MSAFPQRPKLPDAWDLARYFRYVAGGIALPHRIRFHDIYATPDFTRVKAVLEDGTNGKRCDVVLAADALRETWDKGSHAFEREVRKEVRKASDTLVEAREQ